jgi:hypothetical protein
VSGPWAGAAAGTTFLNAAAMYAGMAVGARPAAEASQETRGKLAEARHLVDGAVTYETLRGLGR